MTFNLQQGRDCGRQDCLPCQNEDKNGDCRKESVNYQIRCDRPPCNLDIKEEEDNNLDIGSRDSDHPPSVYRGESSRTLYSRSKNHLQCYRSSNKDTQNKSVLFRHTRDVHEGVLGDGEGIKDYKVSLLSTDKNNPLARQCREGQNIADLEDKEELGRVVCLNSKQDFLQSQRVTLDFRRGERNLT